MDGVPIPQSKSELAEATGSSERKSLFSRPFPTASSRIILVGAFFLFWLLKPISGELVKGERSLINRVITKKSTGLISKFTGKDAPW
jgi:hypothetical protein